MICTSGDAGGLGRTRLMRLASRVNLGGGASIMQGWLITRESGGRQPSHSDEVVGSGDQIACQFGARQATKARPSEATNRFHPAEDLLHAFAKLLTHPIAGMACCSTINCTAAAAGVLRHVWRDATLA